MKRNILNPDTRKIPQLASNVVVNHTYRYSVPSSASAVDISAKGILVAAGAMATVVNSTLTALFNSVKINWIKIWTPPLTNTTQTTSINWAGGPNSVSKEVSETTIGTAEIGFIHTSPPRQSLASFWQEGGASTVLFSLVLPINSVMDINVSLVVQDGDPPITTTAATAVLGTVYYVSLDHVDGQDKIVPVSLKTTA